MGSSGCPHCQARGTVRKGLSRGLGGEHFQEIQGNQRDKESAGASVTGWKKEASVVVCVRLVQRERSPQSWNSQGRGAPGRLQGTPFSEPLGETEKSLLGPAGCVGFCWLVCVCVHLEAPSSLLLKKKKNCWVLRGGDSFYCSHYQDKFEHSGCTERAKNKIKDTCATQRAQPQLYPWNGTGGGRARRSFVRLCLHNAVCVF